VKLDGVDALHASFLKESRLKFAAATKPLLPGGNPVPALVRGSIQHVDTSGVHMLGHLEDLIEFVVQGRLASRSRQRIVTRSQSKFVCTHNEYWYTSAQAHRKCVHLTITRAQRGQRPSPFEPAYGYPGGKRNRSLQRQAAICNKTSGESSKVQDYQSGCSSPNL
jgi:hypothetical protein